MSRQPTEQFSLLGPAGKRPAVRSMTSSSDFWVVVLVPVLVFSMTQACYTYLFLQSAQFCVACSCVILGGSLTLLLFQENFHLNFPLGLTCLCAVILGTLLGLYSFDQFAIFPVFYANSRKYENVVPSEPSAAVGDAGKIVFSTDSRVAAERAVSYVAENGGTYCVAPVQDNNPVTRIEFWAVGLSCCGRPKGDFSCDSSTDNTAHSGIVVFDNNGYFSETRIDYFEKARKKAEAEFGLQSVASPMYVRWVKEDNLDMLSNYYRNVAIAFVLGSTALYYLLSFGFSAALFTPRKQVQKYAY